MSRLEEAVEAAKAGAARTAAELGDARALKEALDRELARLALEAAQVLAAAGPEGGGGCHWGKGPIIAAAQNPGH
jgi:hypothetical protein